MRHQIYSPLLRFAALEKGETNGSKSLRPVSQIIVYFDVELDCVF
jgi:hypothetical protein